MFGSEPMLTGCHKGVEPSWPGPTTNHLFSVNLQWHLGIGKWVCLEGDHNSGDASCHLTLNYEAKALGLKEPE